MILEIIEMFRRFCEIKYNLIYSLSKVFFYQRDEVIS